jgi:hypothetical protein
MGYRLSRTRPFLIVSISILLAAGLSGCTADRYFMVKKQDLGDIEASVKSQRATLVTIEENAATRHDELLDKNHEATQTLLEAIATQVEKPSCPPPEETAKCKSSEEDKGRADRLKGKVVVGEVEKFYLAGPGLIYDARIDSGAETSSIYAKNVQQFERDGNNWVRFDVPEPGEDGEDNEHWVTMEKEISRRVRIIQASTEDYERRAVVELQFAIGNHQQVAEFTLADRENLSYGVLIGRNILRDVMLIDVGKEFATQLPASYRERARNKDDEAVE